MNTSVFKLTNNGGTVKHLSFKSFVFSGGEVSVKLESSTGVDYIYFNLNSPHNILARIRNSNDFFELINVIDAIRQQERNLGVKNAIHLTIPYLPYARQDRVCAKGESFALKLFCDLINSLNVEKVTIFDPHSDVAPALLNNVVVLKQVDIINRFQSFINRVLAANNGVFVSPDAGANKKTSEIAKYFNHREFIRADKLRNLETGEILETIVYKDDLTGKTVFIADDICDGGRTFIELAKSLKSKGADKVILYVTHGIFSKGTETILNSGIDEIYTTNSFFIPDNTKTSNVTVMDISYTLKLGI